MVFDSSVLDDPEVIIRVKRRLPPTEWRIVPYVLDSLKNVLERSMPPAPDPLAPKPAPKAPAKKTKR
jgi:hypothetical protein